MLPRYDASGNLSEKGRTFRFEYDGEILEAKKRDDVHPALEKCPKIQEYFLNKLKEGQAEAVDYAKENVDDEDNMSEEEFLESLSEGNDAEEIESWEDM
jgi:hypothetical protein